MKRKRSVVGLIVAAVSLALIGVSAAYAGCPADSTQRGVACYQDGQYIGMGAQFGSTTPGYQAEPRGWTIYPDYMPESEREYVPAEPAYLNPANIQSPSHPDYDYWRLRRVHRDESLGDIAAQYDVTERELLQINPHLDPWNNWDPNVTPIYLYVPGRNLGSAAAESARKWAIESSSPDHREYMTRYTYGAPLTEGSRPLCVGDLCQDYPGGAFLNEFTRDWHYNGRGQVNYDAVMGDPYPYRYQTWPPPSWGR